MRRWWPFALLVASCNRSGCRDRPDASAKTADGASAATVVDGGPVTQEAATPSTRERLLPAELRDTAPYGNDVKRAVCGARKECSVARETPAGRDASENELVVVTARLGTGNDDGGGASGGEDDPDGPAMEDREHWVVGKRDNKLLFRARIASEWVKTSNAVDDTLTIKGNELTTAVRWWPTSTWQSWPERTFRLWPPVMTSFTAIPQHVGDVDGNVGSTTIDFKDGSGDASYRCPGDRRGEFLPIPSVRRLGAIAASRGLGACATEVDGSPHHGYMAKGKAQKASGHFRIALLSDKPDGTGAALYIEAHDDRWTQGDTIEVRVGRPAGFMACGDDLTRPRSYVIDSAGAVKPSTGLTVERIRDEGGIRLFRVTGEMRGISVSQTDDDGDGAPPRVFATTPVTSKELGDFAHIADVACEDAPDGPILVPMIAPSAD